MSKKILHIIDDDKFTDSAYYWAEKTMPGVCEFIILKKDDNLKYVNKTKGIVIKSKKIFSTSVFKLVKRHDVIIVHKLNLIKMIFLFFFKKGKKKLIWVGYGVDYYRYISPNKKELLLPLTQRIFSILNNNLKNILRKILYQSIFVKRIINKFDYIAPVIYEDYILLKKKADWLSPSYIYFNYGTSNWMNIESKIKYSNDGNNILIGNSASYDNNHIDIFNQLSDFNLSKHKIICPLSYGDNEYRKEVIKAGESIFGNNFVPLLDFIPYEDYTKIISSCSIVVMNHMRQKGLGNINYMLYVGAKIYLREESPAYDYLSKIGYKIFSINKIKSEFDFLSELNELDKLNNYELRKIKMDKNKFEQKISKFYKKII